MRAAACPGERPAPSPDRPHGNESILGARFAVAALDF